MQNQDENINSEFIESQKQPEKYKPEFTESEKQGGKNNSEFIDSQKPAETINSDFIEKQEQTETNKLDSTSQSTEENTNGERTSDLQIENEPANGNEGSVLTEEEFNVQNVKEENDTIPEETDEWLDILGSGQLKRKILKRAENSFRPQNSYICEINVEGCLEDGTIVDKFDHLKIQLGDAEIVQGLDLTLPLMHVGEECLVEVAPRFAYGVQGRDPDVPPNSKITYRLDLLSAEPETELESLPIQERKKIGNQKRERGNWWYARQDYTFAIQCYRRALEFLDDVEGGINYTPKDEDKELGEELHNLFEDRLKVYNNLAAAQMKIRAYDTALQSVENVLHCQPKNVKALFRKGKILAAKGDNGAAVAVLRGASQLEPENKIIKQELLRLVSLRNEDTRNERNLYKKMLGQEKNAGTSTKGPSKSYQIRWGIVFGSVAAVVAGMVAYRYKFL